MNESTTQDFRGYAVSPETLLLIGQEKAGMGRGITALGGAVVLTVVAIVASRTPGAAEWIGVALVLALCALTVFLIRPIIGVAIEPNALVLIKLRYPSFGYALRVSIADIAELIPNYIHGTPVLTIHMRSGKRHIIGLGALSKNDPPFDVLVNRSGVPFPADTRNGAAMAQAIIQVFRNAGVQNVAS